MEEGLIMHTVAYIDKSTGEKMILVQGLRRGDRVFTGPWGLGKLSEELINAYDGAIPGDWSHPDALGTGAIEIASFCGHFVSLNTINMRKVPDVAAAWSGINVELLE